MSDFDGAMLSLIIVFFTSDIALAPVEVMRVELNLQLVSRLHL